MEKGYTIDHVVTSGQLITIFSAPDYPQFQVPTAPHFLFTISFFLFFCLVFCTFWNQNLVVISIYNLIFFILMISAEFLSILEDPLSMITLILERCCLWNLKFRALFNTNNQEIVPTCYQLGQKHNFNQHIHAIY